MTPIRVTATLYGSASVEQGVALDGLLAAMVALERNLGPIAVDGAEERIEIPIAKSECGRFHLCSHSMCEPEEYSVHYIHKRAPIDEFAELGGATVKRVDVTAGVNKSYRIPIPMTHLKDDTVTWFAIGDRAEVAHLLQRCTHVGRKRAHGNGRVKSWSVEECEPWGEGFPVVLDGRAMRPLPLDYPGLVSPRIKVAVLTFPYWDQTRLERLACP